MSKPKYTGLWHLLTKNGPLCKLREAKAMTSDVTKISCKRCIYIHKLHPFR